VTEEERMRACLDRYNRFIDADHDAGAQWIYETAKIEFGQKWVKYFKEHV